MLPEQERKYFGQPLYFTMWKNVRLQSMRVMDRLPLRTMLNIGETTVRTLLYRDIPAPFNIREHIASLVRHHGLPIWLMEREDPLKRACEASLRLDTSLLKQLTFC